MNLLAVAIHGCRRLCQGILRRVGGHGRGHLVVLHRLSCRYRRLLLQRLLVEPWQGLAGHGAGLMLHMAHRPSRHACVLCSAWSKYKSAENAAFI